MIFPYILDRGQLMPSRCHRESPREQASWGQHEAHLRPVGPRWAPCWSQGSLMFLTDVCELLQQAVRYELALRRPIYFVISVHRLGTWSLWKPAKFWCFKYNTHTVVFRHRFSSKRACTAQVPCFISIDCLILFYVINRIDMVFPTNSVDRELCI